MSCINTQRQPHRDHYRYLLHFNGEDGHQGFVRDMATYRRICLTGSNKLSKEAARFGESGLSMRLYGVLFDHEPEDEIDDQDFTIEAWVKPLCMEEGGGLLYYRSAGSYSFNLYFTENGQLVFNTRWVGVVADVITTKPGQLVQDVYQHLALTREGSLLRIWVDGKCVGAGQCTLKFGGGQMYLGYSNAPGLSFNGYMDEFRYLVGIAAYNEKFTPPTSAFVIPLT